jgi:hypothetical protein
VTPRKYVVLYDVVVVVCLLLAISDTVRGATVKTVEGLNPWITRVIQSLDESANVPTANTGHLVSDSLVIISGDTPTRCDLSLCIVF